ncbi:MAG: lipid A export permease/ATP-binding protein MsbA [Burkholderiales bacterium]
MPSTTPSPASSNAPSNAPSAAPFQPLSWRRRIRRVLPYFRPYQAGFAVSSLATVLVAASEPAMAWLLQQMLDHGFRDGTFPLWLVPVVLIGIFLVRGISTFVSQYSLSWFTLRGVEDMRKALFTRLMNAHPLLYVQRTASSLINTVSYEIQTGAQQLAMSGMDVIRDTFTLVALFAYLLWMNWQLTLFVTVLFPLVGWVMRTLSRRLHRLTVQSQQAIDQLAYVVEENVLAWRIVRMHGAEAQQAKRFERESLALRRLGLKSTAAGATMTPSTQLLAAAALSAVIVTALWQARNGQGTVGSFVGFVTAMLQLIAPIKRLSEVAVPITRGMAALDRGMDLVLTAPSEASGSYRPAVAPGQAQGRAQGSIGLGGVSVQYAADHAPALSDVTLDVPAGQVLALVGPSGSGKTTLINLLARFVEPSAGQVEIDGHDIRTWDIHALRHQFAWVSQDVVLFNDTLAANVALGDAAPDEARVRAALEAANLGDFLRAQTDGLQAPLGHNGQRLSGGQRQRVAIARAIYKDAPILILDEATSALDSESERLVQSALERLMQGRTSIVIAHRLSTIEHADRVAVLEAGRVVELGTHAELLARDGLFAKLHALQFQT